MFHKNSLCVLQILFAHLHLNYCISTQLNELCFIVIGDIGGLPWAPYHTSNQKIIANLLGETLSKQKCSFIVGLGDNFYSQGVKNVSDPRFQSTFEEIYSNSSLNIPWYMIGGNHDHLQNISAQIAYTKLSKKWHYPDYYYTKEYEIPGTIKRVALVMIDTTMLCWYNPKSGAPYPTVQLKWIEETLRECTADYLIVAGHHPVLSAGYHGPTSCLNDKLKPMMEKYKVTAYFNGHDHNLQHLKEDNSSIHYFVSGSGNFINSRMTNIKKVPANALKFHHSKYGGFIFVVINNNTMQTNFLNSQDKKLYSIKIPPRRIHYHINNINNDLELQKSLHKDFKQKSNGNQD